MPKRSATVGYSGAPRSEIAGSLLDPGQSNPPKLPTGLPPAVRTEAKLIVAENPHLDHSQTPGILRLAKMRDRYARIEQQVEEAGFVTYDAKRDREVVHPLLPVLSQLGNAVLSLEKSLAIAFVARSGQVKRAELQKPAAPTKPKAKAGGERVLRLA